VKQDLPFFASLESCLRISFAALLLLATKTVPPNNEGESTSNTRNHFLHGITFHMGLPSKGARRYRFWGRLDVTA
jgi:hypothetical protein